METPFKTTPSHDPLAASLTIADDRVLLSKWMPPSEGILPRVRIGRRWHCTLWLFPIGFAALVLVIAPAQGLREYPEVKAFIARHPGIAQAAPSVDSGFPWWLRTQHFLNMFFMLFIVRSGLQILADHPRLYWKRDCTPGTDWFRFQHLVPADCDSWAGILPSSWPCWWPRRRGRWPSPSRSGMRGWCSTPARS
jgi:sulfoxide reductase catalytic subunit YedY